MKCCSLNVCTVSMSNSTSFTTLQYLEPWLVASHLLGTMNFKEFNSEKAPFECIVSFPTLFDVQWRCRFTLVLHSAGRASTRVGRQLMTRRPDPVFGSASQARLNFDTHSSAFSLFSIRRCYCQDPFFSAQLRR